MSDLEQGIRRALRGMLDPIEPPPSLPPRTLRRARVRRAFNAAVSGSIALLVLAGISGGAIAISNAGGDTPQVAGDPPAQQGPGPRLYLPGDGELWRVDLEGNVKHVELPQLTPGDPPYRIVRREERLVAWGYETLLLDPELESPPSVVISDSWFFIPSAFEDRLWASIMDPETRDTKRAYEFVREVNVEGEVTVQDVRAPGGRWPERALEAGLVFSSNEGWIVWDPASDDVVFRFDADNLGPAYGNLIAWCDAGCRSVHITDVSTGSDRTVEPPDGWSAFDVSAGAFSPDGTTIAVPLRHNIATGDSESEVQLALIDLENGAVTAVEQSGVREGYNFVAWTFSSEYVFLTSGQASEDRTTGQGSEDRRIIVYRMGEAAAEHLEVNVDDFYGAAAI
jgi:hypothetical protein